MNDIDEMDMIGFFRVRAWAARKDRKARMPRPAYIDQVWGDG